jgi:16S rRNA (uracil1498-N3)-methyltransferase
MEIAQPQTPTELFESLSATPVRWLAHPAGRPLNQALADASPGARSEAALAVGPEGGFTDEEVAAARSSQWEAIELGAPILRIETAACAIVVGAALLAGPKR